MAAKLLKKPLKENINGTDMHPFLCRMAATTGHSIFLPGGKPGRAEQADTSINWDFGVRIAVTADGYCNGKTSASSRLQTAPEPRSCWWLQEPPPGEMDRQVP
jgi:N-acetylglucosaminyldiphosphoundecaprenol N-acetyl-beta-D-mannosaminyltransferase